MVKGIDSLSSTLNVKKCLLSHSVNNIVLNNNFNNEVLLESFF